MSKKVGIVTINGLDNYGNLLQNYAVQEAVGTLGFNAETIKNNTRFGIFSPVNRVCKVTPKYIKNYILSQLNYRYNIKNSGIGLIKTIRYCKANTKTISAAKKDRLDTFKSFAENYINWSNFTLDINGNWGNEQDENFDFYIAGSDQVWNPTYPATSAINFLQFAPVNKRIAFSPSFGINKIPNILTPFFSKWISEIPHLSVREEQGRKIIKDLCGRDATVLCDPTMLLSKEQWLKIANKPSFNIKGGYILTYFLGNRTKKYDKYIKNIATKKGFSVINLFDVMSPKYYSVGPREFVYLINNASLVCTDSFHGTVFSILMNTDFVTFSRVENGGSMESRLDTLLKTFNLESRSYLKLSSDDIFNTDFSNCTDILLKKRSESFEFLKTAFETESEIQGAVDTDTVLSQKSQCCGCGACSDVCPVNCITMQVDSEGFKYPQINRDICINCKKCEKVCPLINKTSPIKSAAKQCYVAYSLDSDIRRESSSGGIFTHLASKIIKDGGVVFGASFDGNAVKHIVAQTQEELKKFRGSKYVQSDIGNSYVKTKEFLEEGKKVLFTGTPCQIKGLYAFLGKKEYQGLITQDIICHGVPSPAVWDSYVTYKSDSRKVDISFRDKFYGWHYFSMRIRSGKKVYRKRLDEDFFLKLFLDNTILRPSCYNCSSKTQGTSADITLADCWSPNTVCNGVIDDDKGISLVLINSQTGFDLWESLSANEIKKISVDRQKAISSQKALTTSVAPNFRRRAFFDAYGIYDFETIFKNWYKKSILRDLKKKLVFYKTKFNYLLNGRRRK